MIAMLPVKAARSLRGFSGSSSASVSTTILLAAILAGCSPPSDTHLTNRFESSRSEFEALLRMSQQDRDLRYIDRQVTSIDNEISWSRRDTSLPTLRVQQYRRYMQDLGIEAGIQRRRDFPSAIFFLAECFGSAVDKDCKGYAYSETPLVPLKTTVDDLAPGMNFKPLSGNWYLFRDGG